MTSTYASVSITKIEPEYFQSYVDSELCSSISPPPRRDWNSRRGLGGGGGSGQKQKQNGNFQMGSGVLENILPSGICFGTT